MKNIKIIGGFILAILIFLQSCDLDKDPKNYIPFKDSFTTLSDAEKWDNGLYSTLRGKFGGGYVLPQEVQADMLNAHAAYGNSYAAFHGWSLRSDENVIDAVYHSYYAALTDVNIILECLPKLEVDAKEKATAERRIAQYTGNAHFARAFYYFNLAMRWGMRYDEATANKDLCVPIHTEFRPLVKPGRSTNEKVYALIIEELRLAEEYLASIRGKEGADEITVDAVIALRARVYLYMNKMKEALIEAEKLIESQTYPLIEPLTQPLPEGEELAPDKDPFVQMWQRDNGKEQIFQPFVDKPGELPTITGFYGADLAAYRYNLGKNKDVQFNKPAYLPAGWVLYELFKEAGDRREKAYFEAAYTTVSDPENIYGPLYVISKFKGNPKFRDLESKQWGGYVPNGIQAPKPFRIAEQYLIAAEAAFETDQEKARRYINALRKSRGLSETDLADDALKQLIRDERARELAFEGFRLWDLRRWGMDMKRRLPQVDANGKNYFLSRDFDFELKRENNDDFFVWGFPSVEMKTNRNNMIQNKGW